MKKILLLTGAVMLLAVWPLRAGQEDGRYLKMVKEYELKSDGSWTYHHSHQLQILSYYALNRRFGETFIVFDTLAQSLKINRSETLTPDGRLVPSPDNALNLVLPRFARNSADYNYLREMVVTHTGLEINAVINLDYELTTQAGFLPGMMGDEFLQADVPIDTLILRIRLPEDRPLHFSLQNIEGQPQVSQSRGLKTYQWIFTNRPEYHPEALQPAAGDFLPHLAFSTVGDWQEIFSFLDERLPESLLDESITEQLLDDQTDRMRQILNLQEKMVDGLAELPIPMAVVGFRCRPGQTVWKSASATPLEKAWLMSSALNMAGIQSNVVLTTRDGHIDDAVPGLIGFEEAFVRIMEKNEQPLYLSVHELNRNNAVYSLNGKPALVLNPESVDRETIKADTSLNNAADLSLFLNMSGDNQLNGKIYLTLSGAVHPFTELQRNGGNASGLLKKVASGTEINEAEPSHLSADRLAVAAKLFQKAAFKEQDNFLIYKLPQYPQGFAGAHWPVFSSERKYPLFLESAPLTDKMSLELQLPENVEFAGKPYHLRIKNAVGHLELSLQAVDGKISIVRNIDIFKNSIPPGKYAEFLKLWQTWKNPQYTELVFRKK